MTESKHRKSRIRARMANTGERYMTARRQVLGQEHSHQVRGWPLRGGTHPDTAAVAAVLAHDGVKLSEAMVLGVGGGLGAGYILWQFEVHDAPTLVLGFRNAWQYPDRWMRTTLDRLHVPHLWHETSGAKRAASTLNDAVAAGRPALVTVDCGEIGYWHLPTSRTPRGGYPLVVYAIDGDRVRIDDRNLAPLSVSRARLDASRARVPSYRHRLVVTTPSTVSRAVLRNAARAGIADTVQHLSARSESFGLPAWRKWARMLVDTRHPKAWSNVFAHQRGLAGSLVAAFEQIEPVGTDGGNLRSLYADFLDEAAVLLEAPHLSEAAIAYRASADRWHSLADALLPTDVPKYAALRAELTALHHSVVNDGDAGYLAAAQAAQRMWALRHDLNSTPAAEPDFARLSHAVAEIYEAEIHALELLKQKPA